MSLPISVGIMAFNEAKNIQKLLESVYAQRGDSFNITEVVVVSSGSTDTTNEIVQRLTQNHLTLRLVIEEERLGKVSAINNFLNLANTELIVLVSADLILEANSFQNLINPFLDETVGMVGAHPIPLNNKKTFFGYTAHLLWDLHHKISLDNPKMGEMIAFRKLFIQIPPPAIIDEANIEHLIRDKGKRLVYAPDSIVYNKSAQNLKEFIAVRRRNFCGHYAILDEYKYEVSTISPFRIALVLLKNSKLTWRFFLFTPFIAVLEFYARFLGYLDYKFKLREHSIWEMIPSTKSLS